MAAIMNNVTLCDLSIDRNPLELQKEDHAGAVTYGKHVFSIDYFNRQLNDRNFNAESDCPHSYTVYQDDSADPIGSFSFESFEDAIDGILGVLNIQESLSVGTIITVRDFQRQIGNEDTNWIIIEVKQFAELNSGRGSNYYKVRKHNSRSKKEFWIDGFAVKDIIKC